VPVDDALRALALTTIGAAVAGGVALGE